jgi:phosphoribosylglycinamide formyltransferase-1
MAALIKAAAADDYPAEIALVVSNRAEAGGLEKARASGIATVVVESKPFGKDRAAFEAALQAALDQHGIELICLGGFMRLFTAEFARAWYGRMLNIHPSLLPSFKGLHPHKQALEAGVRVSGCTVHFVTAELDAGAIVAQAAVPVLADDTPQTLADRVLSAEHRLYPFALSLVASGRARLEGGRVRLSALVNPTDPLFSPSP